MIVRNTLVIFAALTISGVLNFLSIAIFSRLLDPSEYGVYALVMSASALGLAFGFNWITHSFMRFIPRKTKDQTYAYTSNFVALSAIVSVLLIVLVCLAWLASGLMPAALGGISSWIWFLVPALILGEFAFTLVTTHARQAQEHIYRYAIAMSARSALAIACAYFLVLGGYSYYGILSGIVISFFLPTLVMVLADKDWRRTARTHIQKPVINEIMAFGLPIIAVTSIQSALGSTDKFLLTFLIDTGATGQYAAALDLVTKLLIFLIMITHRTTYPLVIRKIEMEGLDAARAQYRTNIIFLMLLSIPAAVGIAILAGNIANIFLGEAFRATATAIIPPIVLVSMLNCTFQFYVTPAFHFAKKTKLMIAPVLAALLVNFIVSYLYIPVWGIYGAVLGSFSAYLVCLACALYLARTVFPLPFPAKDFLKIALATAIMALVILPFKDKTDALSFILAIGSGGFVFFFCTALLNTGGLTTMAKEKIAKRRTNKSL